MGNSQESHLNHLDGLLAVMQEVNHTSRTDITPLIRASTPPDQLERVLRGLIILTWLRTFWIFTPFNAQEENRKNDRSFLPPQDPQQRPASGSTATVS
jgi:hypothetical protein